MIASSCKYEALAKRDTFNASVRHIKSTIGLAEQVSDGVNIADTINELIDDESIKSDEILPFVSMLLEDKMGYVPVTKNLSTTVKEFANIQKIVKAWNAFDIIVVYNHPDLGVIAINPKNLLHVNRIDRMNKTELLVVYLGNFGKDFDKSLATKAGENLIALYEGNKVKENPAFLKGKCVYKQAKAPVAEKPKTEKKVAKTTSASKTKKVASALASVQYRPTVVPSASTTINEASYSNPSSEVKGAELPPPKARGRMTPMYGVTVTNELFHNGNVEAWKRIIESYKTKHPDLEVLVYYDGERITNLNALFKWGKVKHGSQIQFAVQGMNICDVAKLQRYLAQGASLMFEAFLKGPVNGVLALF